MERAILYTRVSTDEQNNGYSPADQKDKLIRHCENNNIKVVGIYHDDESGKTFDRPEWIKIMHFIQKNRSAVDKIYFLKWDRFSRNVAEAYITIKNLRKYGVEPQSIEQPLNFEIPESKIMLAIYLAAPEVDNDRRALNIFNGMRRGKKEGRWLGPCLRGYKNTRDANNRPIIIPEGGEKEKLVKKAFSEFATGLYNVEELRRKLQKEGLICNRSAFARMLKNKGYIGKILIPAYKDEPEQWIDGIHTPIIDEKTFYEVQDIIEGRKKNLPNKYNTVRDEFPLRGFLSCPQCGRTLTASASRGKMGNKFYYYHCTKGCKERQKAASINEAFVNLLKDFKSNPVSMKLYAAVLKDRLRQSQKLGKDNLERLNKEIAKQNQRHKNARALMLDGDISSAEFKEMKAEIEENIVRLTNESLNHKAGYENQSKDVDDSLELLLNLDSYYIKRDTLTKQRIVSSIFPEKLIFENYKCRTPKINRVVSLICRKDKSSKGGKKGKSLKNKELSHRVNLLGIKLFSCGFHSFLSILIFQLITPKFLPPISTFYCHQIAT